MKKYGGIGSSIFLYWYCFSNHALWKKPFCFSFPPENFRVKDRNSRCRYQNNLPASHTVFLNHPCQKSYGRKISDRNNRYGRKILAFWCQKRKGRKIPASNYRYGRKIRLPVTADTAGKSRQVTTRYGQKIWLPVTTKTAGKSQQETYWLSLHLTYKAAVAQW